MRFIRGIIIFCVTGIVFLNQAQAENGYSGVTGKVLQEKCRTAVNLMENKLKILDVKTAALSSGDSASCFSYISGVNDAAFSLSQNKSYASDLYKQVSAMPYCFPDGVTMLDYVKTLLRYLDENPSMQGQPGVTVIYQAFKKHYSCY